MCGISCIYSKIPLNSIESRILSMNNSIIHRGPDGGNTKIHGNNIALGHRRLSIIDLDQRANQPMLSNSGKNQIIFNGEIFNFEEIKKELKEFYVFHTQSDTEVLLAAFEIYGIDWLLQRINGMFAFAIFNTDDNSIVIARDRFGIKPLYYYLDENMLIFSSEIKGILNSGLIEPLFNEAAIDDYLGYRYVREPNTFFKNVHHFKTAYYYQFNADLSFTCNQYYELPSINFDKSFDENKLTLQLKHEVEAAVLRWSISDVRLGCYLSGGVDSSLTTAILAEKTKHQIDTYCIGFSDKNFNEFKYAEIVAKKYNTNHHEIGMESSDYFNEMDDLIRMKDAPLAVPNEIPLALMNKRLSDDITVVISGEGADELFGGYGKIFRSGFDFKNHCNDEIFNYSSFYEYFLSKYEYVSRSIRDEFLTTSFEYRDQFDTILKQKFEKCEPEEAIFRFFHDIHIKGLLQRVDMTSMQASIEARPPFLDHELIEFVYTQIPYDLKLKWKNEEAKLLANEKTANEYSEKLDTPKYILKKVSESYLPNEIIYRKKMGFPVPLTNWIEQLITQSQELLSNTTWLKPNTVEELVSKIKTEERAGQLLWMFINIEKFKRIYFSKNWKW